MAQTIMVVDDEPAILRLIELSLKREGYAIRCAGSGPEALRMLEGQLPDLLILDVLMPGMDGRQVCQTIRSQPRTAGIPVIMLSALAQVKDKVAGLHAGADDYVAKPVELSELTARVSALLARSRRQQPDPVKRGRVFAFMGVKGGVGTTTVCLNTAAVLARQQKPVTLIELRPSYGTLSHLLKSTPAETLMSLNNLAPAQIDGKELNGRLYNAGNGVKILFGPQKAGDDGGLDPDRSEAIVRQASMTADFVVIDLPSMPSAASRAAASLADVFVLLLEPEPSCLTAALVNMEMLNSWRISKAATGAVVTNRASAINPLTLREIKDRLGCEILGIVTPAAEACLAAQERGTPLVIFKPENMAAVALTELANRLAAGNLVGIRS